MPLCEVSRPGKLGSVQSYHYDTARILLTEDRQASWLQDMSLSCRGCRREPTWLSETGLTPSIRPFQDVLLLIQGLDAPEVMLSISPLARALSQAYFPGTAQPLQASFVFTNKYTTFVTYLRCLLRVFRP